MDAHLSGATSSQPYGYRVPQYAAPLGILAQPVPLVSVVPPGLEIDDAPVTHPVVLEPDPPDWLKYTVDFEVLRHPAPMLFVVTFELVTLTCHVQPEIP